MAEEEELDHEVVPGQEVDAHEEEAAGYPEEEPYLYGGSGSEDAGGYRARRQERYHEARASERAGLACEHPESVALSYKDSGNSSYSAKDYLGAAGLYTLALEALPSTRPTCLVRAPKAASAQPEAEAVTASAGGGSSSGGENSSSSSSSSEAALPASAASPPQPEPTATEVLRATCHCNRAACHVALLQWEEALWDCDRALELKPSYAKALARRGAALEHLSMLDEALADFQAAAAIDPASARQLSADMERVKKLVEERDENLKVRPSCPSLLSSCLSLHTLTQPHTHTRCCRMKCLASSRIWATACWAGLACRWTASRLSRTPPLAATASATTPTPSSAPCHSSRACPTHNLIYCPL